MPLLAGVTYTQSAVYSGNTAADYAGMNDGSANGSVSSQTGTPNAASFVKADLGAAYYVNRIVIGYDYLNNLPGGWGVSYTQAKPVQGSTDDITYTTIATTPTYASTKSTNGLVSITINGNWRYIKITSTGYLALLEFQVWTGMNPRPSFIKPPMTRASLF